MNTPVIWIVFPLITAIFLYFIRRWARVIYVVGIFIVCLLAWLAWQLPTGDTSTSIKLWAGLPTIRIAESLTIMGQRFILSNKSHPAIMLIYLGIGFWLCGAYLSHVDRLFVPLGISIATLQVAALAIESGWRIPLILVLIALIVVPLLSQPGKPVKRGALRFITFQTIGACLLLFSERWWLTTMTTTGNIDPFPAPLLVMGVGYAFILSAIPFHAWVSMSADEINPYTLAFILYVLPAGLSFVLLRNLDDYILLGASTEIYSGLRWLGIWMFVTASVWAAFERRLGRMLGVFALAQAGVLLLIISMNSGTPRNPSIVGVLFLQQILMGIGFAMWALALRNIQLRGFDLRLDRGKGLAYSMPITACCLLITQFSLCGLPLFASFQIYTAIWTTSEQLSLNGVPLFIIGIPFLFLAVLRTLNYLISNNVIENYLFKERKLHSMLLILGCTTLLIIGLAPQWFVPLLTRLGGVFIGANP